MSKKVPLLKRLLLFFTLIVTLQSSAHADSINLFLFAKDAFFDLAGNYIFLIVIAIIFFAVALAAMMRESMTPLIWGAVGIFCISIIPVAAPGSISFFKSYAPSTTVQVTP